MTDLRGRTALITGAASGIGRLLALKLAAKGSQVVLWDLHEGDLTELTAFMRRSGGAQAWSFACDVADRRAVYATAARVLDECGPVDVLINNAGIVSGDPILEATDAGIERTFKVNTLAHFWTVRAFLPTMIEQRRGHIVTVASAGGLVGAPRLTDYSASKFAAVGFDESLRLELARAGLDIKTTVVCPTYVSTGMFAGAKMRFPRLIPILDPDYVAERIVKAIETDRRRLVMPRFVYVALALRWLPPPIFDALVGFFGVSRSMDEFKGRGGRSVG